jgi:glycosyltransferase involved in cell wall biosynthesis
VPGPKLSVIICAYNAEAFLAEAAASVLEQDFEDLELLISDDGSTDGTRGRAEEIRERDPERVTVLHERDNQGKSAAANRALAVARSELIAWLDADDVMLPGKLSAQVELLDRRPDAVGCCHDAEVFDSETDTVLGSFSQIYNGRPLREGGVELWFDPTYRSLPSATMFRASAVPPGGLDTGLRRANDWLFDIEVFRHGRCAVIPEVLVRYRRHPEQMTSERLRSEWFQEGLAVMEIVESRYPELRARARASRAALLLGESRRLARSGRRREALRRVGEAARAGGPFGLARVAGHVLRASRERRGGGPEAPVRSRAALS